MNDVANTDPVINRPRDPSDLRVPPTRKLFDLEVGTMVDMPITGTDEVFRFNATPDDQVAALLIHDQPIAQLAATGGMSWVELAVILQVGVKVRAERDTMRFMAAPTVWQAIDLADMKDWVVGYWLAREDAR